MEDVGDDFRKNHFDEDNNYEDEYEDKGENFPLLPRTQPLKMRETQRPYKPRTSTGKDETNPYNVAGDEAETSFGGGVRESIPNLDFNEELRTEVNDELRDQAKYYFPRMSKYVQVGQINGRLSVRLLIKVDNFLSNIIAI